MQKYPLCRDLGIMVILPGSDNAEFTGAILQVIEESPLFCSCHSALLEALEEGQELVRRPIAAQFSGHGLRLRQRLLFEFKIGVEIQLRCFHGFMTEPQSNHRAIHAMLQQLHGGAVAENVWGH